MTKELLEKLKKIKSNKEVEKIINDTRSILTDEELEQVSGGVGRHFSHM